jgi:5-methylcytosine-specific restriction endonuclease McrA
VELTCAHCAQPFARKSRGPAPTYCSTSCRVRASELRAEADGRLAQWRANAKAREPEPEPTLLTCHQCSMEFLHPNQPGHTPKFCSLLCKDRDQVARWRADGRYAALKAKQRGPGAACLECSAPLRTGAIRCRVCQGERPHIPISIRRAVYERDGWECQLCDLPVDRDARFPDLWCATLDHVVPYSRGGSDDEDNLQLTHFTCNCRKQDRVPVAYPPDGVR